MLNFRTAGCDDLEARRTLAECRDAWDSERQSGLHGQQLQTEAVVLAVEAMRVPAPPQRRAQLLGQ